MQLKSFLWNYLLLQMWKVLLLIFIVATPYTIIAQSTKDSLLLELSAYSNKKEFSLSDTVYINTLNELALNQRYFKLDTLFTLSEKALKISEGLNYATGKINAYLNLGTYYSDHGKIDNAISYFEKAKRLAIEDNNSYLTMTAINDLSTEYSYKSDYSYALKGFLEALEIAQKDDDKYMLSIINESLAGLYVSQKDYEQAMVFFKKVKNINEELGNTTYMAETMSNMASVYADMNELEYAMFNINNSIAIFEEKKIMDWLAYAYEIKGKIYLKRKNYNWAIYWYKQSELLHEDLDDIKGEIALLNGLAETYLHMKKDSLSEKYAINAYEFANLLNNQEGIKEASKNLYVLNKNKNDYKKALYFHEIFEQTSDSIKIKESKKGLNMLKTKMEYDQQKEQLILENEKALAKQKMYVYLVLILLIIFFCIMLLVRRNEKIHKKLNKQLLSKQFDLEQNELHLKEVNETKDKLFSIIGHDLRGPIGAFQGLLKLFKEDQMSTEEFAGFIPKLKLDIDQISFTLNNLLSWGQTQMNGSITKPDTTSLDILVKENISLLSETALAKSIKFKNELESSVIAWADSNQLDIVIRNLLSNALKFTPENGKIIIRATERNKHWEVVISDNGMGMTRETIGKLFKKDSNHTTYGTNNEKGTGLGLSLCKEMIEKNNGTIWAESLLNKGSSFYFTVPKLKKAYKKSA